VHEAVEFRPGGRKILEQSIDLRIVAHVAIENQIGAEFAREFGDAVLETLAHVTESKLRPLSAAGLGDAVRDRAVRQ